MKWLKDLIFWKRDYKRYQAEMWDLYAEGHDIGTLPGGHMIHYSVCWYSDYRT